MHDEPHDNWASVYDEAYQKSFGGIYSSLTDLTLDFVQTNTKSGASILDVGAGTGRLSIPLSEFGFTVVAVDASSEMLKVLGQKDLKNRIQTIHSKVQYMDHTALGTGCFEPAEMNSLTQSIFAAGSSSYLEE